jgi:beta-phosphoglucomutase-like phosphatase (HAD superfamily)
MKKNWNFPKAFLFDLDGVLIDSEPLHGQAWKQTASFFFYEFVLNKSFTIHAFLSEIA